MREKMPSNLKIEELEERIAPATLTVAVPADTAAVTTVPSTDGTTVNVAATAADGAPVDGVDVVSVS
jgi:hypothetical protein